VLADKYRQLIAVALRAAPAGFVLGGSAALIEHGLTAMHTKVIDLVSQDADRDPAGAVEAALRRHGYASERLDQNSERANILPPTAGTLAQWRVPLAGRHEHPPIEGHRSYTCGKCLDRAYLVLGRSSRSRDPVSTEIGPILHPEDAAGLEVRALARNGRARDFAQTADLLQHWSPAELIGFAKRLDPALADRDFSRAASRLDSQPDIAFTALGVLRPHEVSWVREQFARWPREAHDIERQGPGREREREVTAVGRLMRTTRKLPAVSRRDKERQATRDEPEIGRLC